MKVYVVIEEHTEHGPKRIRILGAFKDENDAVKLCSSALFVPIGTFRWYEELIVE